MVSGQGAQSWRSEAFSGFGAGGCAAESLRHLLLFEASGHRELDQSSDRFDIQFSHQVGAVALDRPFVDAKIGGDLFVQLAAQDVGQDLALAGCESPPGCR